MALAQVEKKTYRRKRTVIDLKTANLLRHSHVISQYPWLRDLLESSDRVTDAEYDDLPDDHKRIIDDINSVRTQAVNEWKVLPRDTVDLGAVLNRCSLCNTKIRYEYHIQNAFTSEEIIVGSECVKEFGFRVEGNKSLDQLTKDLKRLYRRQQIAKEFPGLDDTLRDWRLFLERQEVLIPKRLRKPYGETVERLEGVYEALVGDRISDRKGLPQLRALWDELISHRDKIQAYVQEVRDHPFAPTATIVRHLRNAKRYDVLEMLEDDELIQPKTVHRITEPGFLRSLVPRWNRILQPIGITFTGIDEMSSSYVFRPPAYPEVELSIYHQRLCLVYGPMLFDVEPLEELSRRNLIEKCSVHGSTVPVVDLLLPWLQRLGYRRYRRYDDSQTLVLSEPSGQFVVLPERDLVETLKSVALGVALEPLGVLSAYLKDQRHTRFTEQQLAAFEEARRGIGKDPSRP